jgi:hypothetical protein
MNRVRTLSCLFATALLSAAALAQPVTNAWTYQGQLNDGAAVANGPYDFIFRLFNASSGGTQIGSNVAINDRQVSDGLFTVSLDFGAAFDGTARWLDIQVRPGASTGAYTLLTPRQPLTATPYALYALNSANSNSPWVTSGADIHNTNSGNVGIGTTNPLTKLHIAGGEESTTLATGTIFMQSAGGPFGQIMTMDGDEINGWSGLSLNPHPTTDIDMVLGGGNVGVGIAASSFKLDVNGRIHVRQNGTSSAGIYFFQDTPNADRGFVGMRTDTQIGFYGTQGAGWGMVMDVATGNVGINTTAPAAQFHVNGTARVNVLEIVGADVAEKFPVSDAARPEPGAVVMIDSSNPGKLCLAQGAYNKKVAGVISGANGLPAGTVLGHLPGNDDAPAVALSGRVWVQCDATTQAIEVGDLLTTSDTPGHAMTASDAARSHGAVIGKAMTALAQGEKGMVLVLVNLQ